MALSPEQATLESVELDQRTNDKLTVTLWWVKGTIETYVTVDDDGNHSVIPVPEGISPHEVYYHPFSYDEHDGKGAE